MLNGLDAVSSRFLSDLQRIQDRNERAQRQISSGLRVENASDAPEQVAEILRLRTRVDMNTQVQTNLARVGAQVNTAEAAVREAVSLVERARVMATEAGTTGATNRKTLAIEARGLHDRLLALSGLVSEGRYVFGGDGTTTPPYVADSTDPSGARRASGAATNSALVIDDNDVTFSAFRTASEVFDAPGAENAFKALEDLVKGLENDSETDVQAAMPGLVATLDHLNQQLAFYGGAQNRVTNAVNTAKKNAVALRADLSRLQDADIPTAILELNSSQVHHETALAAHSRLPKSTLFDFLG